MRDTINNDMVGTSLLTSVFVAGGLTIAGLVYKVARLTAQVDQAAAVVGIVADQTEAGFKYLQDNLHENLQQMAVIIANNLREDEDGGTN